MKQTSPRMNAIIIFIGGWLLPHLLYWPVMLGASFVSEGYPNRWDTQIIVYMCALFFCGTTAAMVGLFRIVESRLKRGVLFVVHASVNAAAFLASCVASAMIYMFIEEAMRH